jgi:putative FmdB family regulatory protein
MPVYEYEHQDKPCQQGRIFEIVQSIKDDRLEICPTCGGKITRLISGAFISTPTTVSEYKSMGFTRLEKRDDGVYENVTRSDGEARYMEAGKPETLPNIKKKIRD